MERLEYIQNYRSEASGATSMVTLILPPNTCLSNLRQMLKNEYATATNIRNNVNRKSVKKALTSLITRVNDFKQLPFNGIALYSEQCV